MSAAVVVAAVFVAGMLVTTSGHFVPQVVDLYLVCRYAQAMAEGHPFQYNAGDAPTTGATSLLHTAVLGAAHAAGFRGEGLIAFAILTGAALYVASVGVAARIAHALSSRREGILAGLLVAFGGPVVWLFLYGADGALAAAAALWVFSAWLAAWDPSFRGARAFALAASLLALTRPEGLPLAVFLALAWAAGPGRGASPRQRVLMGAPIAAGAAVLAVNRVLTGHWVGTSLADKSLFENYGFVDAVGFVAEYAVDVGRGVLLGFYPSTASVGFSRGWAALAFPPLGLLLVVFAAASLPRPARTAVLAWIAATLVVLGLTSANTFAGVHFNRYALWAFPPLLVLAALGLGRLARTLAAGDAGLESRIFSGGGALLVLLGLLATVRFAALYAGAAGDVFRRDLALARWISSSLPAGVRMANVATSVEYLTGHRSVNLHGVTSPEFLGGRTFEREAAVLEGLARMPGEQRPPYLITSAAAQEASTVLREVAVPPALFRTTSFSDEIEVYRTRYDSLDAAGRPHLPETLAAVAGLSEIGALNVADRPDERRADYRWRSEVGGLRLGGSARVASYAAEAGGARVADAGRAVIGEESFRVRASPGRDLVLVLRTSAEAPVTVFRTAAPMASEVAFPEAGFDLSVDGAKVGPLRFRPRPGWEEVVVRIPAAHLKTAAPRLALVGRYASYRYWFYQ